MTLWEIALRLGAATIIGGAIGLNRDLHHKASGVRTLGLVSLAAALVVMVVIDLAPSGTPDPGAVSRVVQGILTGIGFLGAGLILHDVNGARRVHGLTTAACTWLTACIGIACGAGNWKILFVAIVLLFLLLMFGGKLERLFRTRSMSDEDIAPEANKD